MPQSSILGYNIDHFFNLPEVKILFPAFFLHYIAYKSGQYLKYRFYLRLNYGAGILILLITPLSIILFLITGETFPDHIGLSNNFVLFMVQQVLAFTLSITSFILSIHILLHLKEKVTNEYSEILLYDLNWLKQFISINAVICILWGIELLIIALNVEGEGILVNLTWTVLVLMIYWVSYRSFQLKDFEQEPAGSIKPIKENKAKIILGEEEAKSIKRALSAVMRDEMLFLKPNLTIHELSKHLSIPHRKISNVIKEYENANFSIWLNSFRVDHAIKLLKEQGMELTIEAIGSESGFNSRSSLYLAFKKIKASTPSDFLVKNVV